MVLSHRLSSIPGIGISGTPVLNQKTHRYPVSKLEWNALNNKCSLMLEKLGNRTINAVFFRLCELFQVGVLVGSLYYVLERENLSSRCPLPPWPSRFIMLLGKIIFRLNALTTLAGSNYYVLVRENLSSRCPLPPWPDRTIMFLCERICRHDVPYHPGRVVLLCSCAREFFVSMPLTSLTNLSKLSFRKDSKLPENTC